MLSRLGTHCFSRLYWKQPIGRWLQCWLGSVAAQYLPFIVSASLPASFHLVKQVELLRLQSPRLPSGCGYDRGQDLHGWPSWPHSRNGLKHLRIILFQHTKSVSTDVFLVLFWGKRCSGYVSEVSEHARICPSLKLSSAEATVLAPKPCLSARRSQESLAVSSFLDLKEALGGPLDVVSLGKYPIEFDDYPAQTSHFIAGGYFGREFHIFFPWFNHTRGMIPWDDEQMWWATSWCHQYDSYDMIDVICYTRQPVFQWWFVKSREIPVTIHHKIQ